MGLAKDGVRDQIAAQGSYTTAPTMGPVTVHSRREHDHDQCFDRAIQFKRDLGQDTAVLKKKIAPAIPGKRAETVYVMTLARTGSIPNTIAVSWSSRIAISPKPNLLFL